MTHFHLIYNTITPTGSEISGTLIIDNTTFTEQ